MATKRTIYVLASIVGASLLLLVLIFRRDVGTWYVSREIRLATTPEEELRAFERMNHWGHWHSYGYRVEAVDIDGNPVRALERISSVTITWDNGVQVQKTITHANSLSYVFGE